MKQWIEILQTIKKDNYMKMMKEDYGSFESKL